MKSSNILQDVNIANEAARRVSVMNALYQELLDEYKESLEKEKTKDIAFTRVCENN